MKHAIIVLLAFSLTPLTVAQNKKVPWKEMAYASDGFAITVPYPPLPHADANIPETNTYPIYFPDADGIRLSLCVMHQSRNCSETLGRLKRNPSADPSSIRELSIDGHPGLEYRWQTDRDTMGLERYYCVNDRWYIFAARWPKAHQYPPLIDRVIKSFRLTKAE